MHRSIISGGLILTTYSYMKETSSPNLVDKWPTYHIACWTPLRAHPETPKMSHTLIQWVQPWLTYADSVRPKWSGRVGQMCSLMQSLLGITLESNHNLTDRHKRNEVIAVVTQHTSLKVPGDLAESEMGQQAQQPLTRVGGSGIDPSSQMTWWLLSEKSAKWVFYMIWY